MAICLWPEVREKMVAGLTRHPTGQLLSGKPLVSVRGMGEQFMGQYKVASSSHRLSPWGEEQGATTYYPYWGEPGPMLVHGSVVSASFSGIAVSYQMNETVPTQWIDMRPMGTEFVFPRVNLVGAEPVSGPEALRRFSQYAGRLIAKQGIRLLSTKTRDWASVEDPNWKQWVVDFEVDAPSEVALALWDRLGKELHDFLEALEGKRTSKLHDQISITVQWK